MMETLRCKPYPNCEAVKKCPLDKLEKDKERLLRERLDYVVNMSSGMLFQAIPEIDYGKSDDASKKIKESIEKGIPTFEIFLKEAGIDINEDGKYANAKKQLEEFHKKYDEMRENLIERNVKLYLNGATRGAVIEEEEVLAEKIAVEGERKYRERFEAMGDEKDLRELQNMHKGMDDATFMGQLAKFNPKTSSYRTIDDLLEGETQKVPNSNGLYVRCGSDGEKIFILKEPNRENTLKVIEAKKNKEQINWTGVSETDYARQSEILTLCLAAGKKCTINGKKLPLSETMPSGEPENYTQWVKNIIELYGSDEKKRAELLKQLGRVLDEKGPDEKEKFLFHLSENGSVEERKVAEEAMRGTGVIVRNRIVDESHWYDNTAPGKEKKTRTYRYDEETPCLKDVVVKKLEAAEKKLLEAMGTEPRDEPYIAQCKAEVDNRSKALMKLIESNTEEENVKARSILGFNERYIDRLDDIAKKIAKAEERQGTMVKKAEEEKAGALEKVRRLSLPEEKRNLIEYIEKLEKLEELEKLENPDKADEIKKLKEEMAKLENVVVEGKNTVNGLKVLNEEIYKCADDLKGLEKDNKELSKKLEAPDKADKEKVNNFLEKLKERDKARKSDEPDEEKIKELKGALGVLQESLGKDVDSLLEVDSEIATKRKDLKRSKKYKSELLVTAKKMLEKKVDVDDAPVLSLKEYLKKRKEAADATDILEKTRLENELKVAKDKVVDGEKKDVNDLVEKDEAVEKAVKDVAEKKKAQDGALKEVKTLSNTVSVNEKPLLDSYIKSHEELEKENKKGDKCDKAVVKKLEENLALAETGLQSKESQLALTNLKKHDQELKTANDSKKEAEAERDESLKKVTEPVIQMQLRGYLKKRKELEGENKKGGKRDNKKVEELKNEMAALVGEIKSLGDNNAVKAIEALEKSEEGNPEEEKVKNSIIESRNEFDAAEVGLLWSIENNPEQLKELVSKLSKHPKGFKDIVKNVKNDQRQAFQTACVNALDELVDEEEQRIQAGAIAETLASFPVDPANPERSSPEQLKELWANIKKAKNEKVVDLCASCLKPEQKAILLADKAELLLRVSPEKIGEVRSEVEVNKKSCEAVKQPRSDKFEAYLNKRKELLQKGYFAEEDVTLLNGLAVDIKKSAELKVAKGMQMADEKLQKIEGDLNDAKKDIGLIIGATKKPEELRELWVRLSSNNTLEEKLSVYRKHFSEEQKNGLQKHYTDVLKETNEKLGKATTNVEKDSLNKELVKIRKEQLSFIGTDPRRLLDTSKVQEATDAAARGTKAISDWAGRGNKLPGEGTLLFIYLDNRKKLNDKIKELRKAGTSIANNEEVNKLRQNVADAVKNIEVEVEKKENKKENIKEEAGLVALLEAEDKKIMEVEQEEIDGLAKDLSEEQEGALLKYCGDTISDKCVPQFEKGVKEAEAALAEKLKVVEGIKGVRSVVEYGGERKKLVEKRKELEGFKRALKTLDEVLKKNPNDAGLAEEKKDIEEKIKKATKEIEGLQVKVTDATKKVPDKEGRRAVDGVEEADKELQKQREGLEKARNDRDAGLLAAIEKIYGFLVANGAKRPGITITNLTKEMQNPQTRLEVLNGLPEPYGTAVKKEKAYIDLVKEVEKLKQPQKEQEPGKQNINRSVMRSNNS
ncbi:MAG: hypothetical protein WCH10_01465 [bacterium]